MQTSFFQLIVQMLHTVGIFGPCYECMCDYNVTLCKPASDSLQALEVFYCLGRNISWEQCVKQHDKHISNINHICSVELDFYIYEDGSISTCF